ncbi:MAG: methylated-DNA--[protein]-cysteine S-methyltransferase [Clostridiales bacterium]|nr:methylated-DNA--[protein]-cysteine S-methyltransferase [Clostridiales bacterium]
MIDICVYDSSIGELVLAAKENALVGLWMKSQKYYFGSLKGEQTKNGTTPILVQAKSWLDRYFAGEKPAISELLLAPEGSDFRKAVWAILCEIPYGETITYGELAKKAAGKIGKEQMSAQAVGGAVGHNPISIIIPCHRVVGAGGSLTGYAGGIEKKIYLLTHEGVNMEELYVPKNSTAP